MSRKRRVFGCTSAKPFIVTSSEDASARFKILVVDDDPGVRKLLRAFLESLGHEVAEACDGRAVRNLCQNVAPDIVILDLMMPERDGIETIRMLTTEFPAIRRIVMSGTFYGVFLRVAEQLGAHAVLPKPFSMDELLLALTPTP